MSSKAAFCPHLSQRRQGGLEIRLISQRFPSRNQSITYLAVLHYFYYYFYLKLEWLEKFATNLYNSMYITWHVAWFHALLHIRYTCSLTPVPAVTDRDEPWPFFHFWRHHLWPKLVSSMLHCWERKRSLQWYPDQSDRKTQSKFCCHYTRLLHVSIDLYL